MTDIQKGSLPRQPGCRLPRRSSAELLDLGRERRPGVLLVLPHDRITDGPQAVPPLLPPLFYLRLGQGSIVLDLVSQAQERDRVPGTYPGNACFDALVSAPERDGGQVPTLGTASCPGGRAVGAAFTQDGTRATGEGAGPSLNAAPAAPQ